MQTPALRLLTILSLLPVTALTSRAVITVPAADGSDGVLNITDNTEIDLSQAVTGAWSQNNAANAGKGVYDAAKWAVVFKYSSVTIAAGKTLTFKNHASRAPVVWLVNGNVTVDGIVSLNGAAGATAPALAENGPGGHRGGAGIYSAGVTGSAGFGIGGGGIPGNDGIGGSYGSPGGGAPSTATYGNPSLIPLLGGSGGAGTNNNNGNLLDGGGGGGGAILIACTNALTIAGQVRAIGGNGSGPNWRGAAGSGGGIRLVADTLSGAGSINAQGGVISGGNPGGVGRIRLERAVNTNTLTVVPDPSVVPLTAGTTALLWPPAGAPEVRVVSIGAVAAPADPRASFGSAGADVALPQTATTQAVIETTNVEQASTLQVRVTPRSGGTFTTVTAAVDTVVSASPLVIRWTATLPVNAGYSAVQVKVIRP